MESSTDSDSEISPRWSDTSALVFEMFHLYFLRFYVDLFNYKYISVYIT